MSYQQQWQANKRPKSKYKPYFYVNKIKTKFGEVSTFTMSKELETFLRKKNNGTDVVNFLTESFLMMKTFPQPRLSPSGKSLGVGMVVGVHKNRGPIPSKVAAKPAAVNASTKASAFEQAVTKTLSDAHEVWEDEDDEYGGEGKHPKDEEPDDEESDEY